MALYHMEAYIHAVVRDSHPPSMGAFAPPHLKRF